MTPTARCFEALSTMMRKTDDIKRDFPEEQMDRVRNRLIKEGLQAHVASHMFTLLSIVAVAASGSPRENERAVRAVGGGSDHAPAPARARRATAGRAIAVPTAPSLGSEAAPARGAGRASARRGARASTATRANAARAPQVAVSMASAEAVLARADRKSVV